MPSMSTRTSPTNMIIRYSLLFVNVEPPLFDPVESTTARLDTAHTPPSEANTPIASKFLTQQMKMIVTTVMMEINAGMSTRRRRELWHVRCGRESIYPHWQL